MPAPGDDGDGFVASGRGWHVTYLNATAEPVLGDTKAELVGRLIWETFPDTEHTEFG